MGHKYHMIGYISEVFHFSDLKVIRPFGMPALPLEAPDIPEQAENERNVQTPDRGIYPARSTSGEKGKGFPKPRKAKGVD